MEYPKFDNKNKDFRNDLIVLHNLLKAKTNFSFSKYADGEYAILENRTITVQPADNWTFTAEKDEVYRQELINSFKYYEPGYYVGISCPCCQPMPHIAAMRSQVGAHADYVTWANIFVNGNYKFYIENFIPEYKKRDVVIVASEKGSKDSLPFAVSEYIPIKQTAWRDNFNLVEELSNRSDSGKLYLFCAGPLGNMLAAKLWTKNKNNTYLDIGSTINPWIVGKNRDYMFESNAYFGKNCIW